VLGHLKESFVHQVLDDCLPANIDDKCDLRSNLGYVGKILFRSHPNIGASGSAQGIQLAQDVKIGSLVGYKIIRTKISILLRKLPDNAGEF
jgi:hypothetical protein